MPETLTLPELASDLRRSADRLRDTAPLMRECSFAMVAGCKANIEGGHDPNGVPYAPLRWREGRALLDTGDLYLSILPDSTPTTATAGTDIPWAWVHNEGCFVPEKTRGADEKPWVFPGLDGEPIFTRRIKSHVIPQREFVGWGEPLVETVVGIVAGYAERCVNGEKQ